MNDSMELYWLSATEAVSQIQSGRLTSSDYISACIDRIRLVEDRVKAWEFIDVELPLAHAQEMDARRLGGEDVGALQGVPVGVKDIFKKRRTF